MASPPLFFPSPAQNQSPHFSVPKHSAAPLLHTSCYQIRTRRCILLSLWDIFCSSSLRCGKTQWVGWLLHRSHFIELPWSWNLDFVLHISITLLLGGDYWREGYVVWGLDFVWFLQFTFLRVFSYFRGTKRALVPLYICPTEAFLQN